MAARGKRTNKKQGGGGGARRPDKRAYNKQMFLDTLRVLEGSEALAAAKANTATHLDLPLPLPKPTPKTKGKGKGKGKASAETASTEPGEAEGKGEGLEVGATGWPGDAGNHPPYKTVVEHMAETPSLTAALRIGDEGPPGLEVCVLNFASARHPGGGVTRGSNAQEESLCRVSGLFQCLEGNAMYRLNERDNKSCIYHNAGIFSPLVPVVKTDSGEPLPEPRLVSFVTVPAVNRSVASKRVSSTKALDDAMAARVDGLLSIAAHHGQHTLVLGAFGCGVFGNPPELVARCFSTHLRGKYRGCFRRIVFATINDAEHDALAAVTV